MSMIGEVYESSEINGAIISVQNKGIKLSVWTNNASQDNKINIIAIGYVTITIFANIYR